ncbi:MAG: hypothetical protein QXV22_02260 [Thermoplasmataceae archaeon]
MRNQAKSIIILIFFIICFYLDFKAYLFNPWLTGFSVAASAFALYISSEQFLDNSRGFGSKHGLRGRHVGFYLVSAAAIVDEIFVISIALYRGFGEIAYGTIQGSNVISLALFLVMLPLMYRAPLEENRKDSLVILVSAVLLLLAILFFRIVTPQEVGVALLILFAAYLFSDIRATGTENPYVEDENVYSIPSMVLDVATLFVASDLLVIQTGEIEAHLRISGFIAGFLFPGIVGTLPEIVMFVLSHRRYNQEATVGVVTGTTIYKGTLLLGIAMVISDVNVASGYESVYALILLAIVLFAYSLLARKKA